MRITFMSTDLFAITIPDEIIPDYVDKNDPEAVFDWHEKEFGGSGTFDSPVEVVDYAFNFQFDKE